MSDHFLDQYIKKPNRIRIFQDFFQVFVVSYIFISLHKLGTLLNLSVHVVDVIEFWKNFLSSFILFIIYLIYLFSLLFYALMIHIKLFDD